MLGSPIAVLGSSAMLGGLALYSAAQQLGLPPLGTAAASVVGGALTLAATRVGAAASHRPVRVATLALIAVPAAYAGFVATSQLAAVAGFSAEAQLALAAITGLVVGGLGVKRLGQSKP